MTCDLFCYVSPCLSSCVMCLLSRVVCRAVPCVGSCCACRSIVSCVMLHNDSHVSLVVMSFCTMPVSHILCQLASRLSSSTICILSVYVTWCFVCRRLSSRAPTTSCFALQCAVSLSTGRAAQRRRKLVSEHPTRFRNKLRWTRGGYIVSQTFFNGTSCFCQTTMTTTTTTFFSSSSSVSSFSSSHQSQSSMMMTMFSRITLL